MLTSLGDANDIAPFFEGRNSVALNGRWPCVHAEFEVFPQNWVKAGIIELDGVSSRPKISGIVRRYRCNSLELELTLDTDGAWFRLARLL